jgi:N6-adenosine-specific RNA methylase IME4
MRKAAMEYHQLASLFPLIDGAEFDDLVADISEHGLHEAIVVYEGKILDGRNRFRACEAAGVEPTYTVYQGDDPISFVISLNLRRRHLNESQRAMVAAKLATIKRGHNQHAQICATSQAEAGTVLSVSRRSIQYAREVIENGTPELVHAVEQGNIAVSAAAVIAQKAPEYQKAVVAEVNGGAKPREAQRIVRNNGMATKALPEGKHRVLLVDAPWRYSDDRAGLGDRATTAAEDHYPTMSVAELSALDIGALAADDSVLLCWATFPLLPDALETVKAWGFTYKTAFVWHKDRGSFGHYHRADAELLLVCTRGSCTPDSGKRESQVQSFARTKHSAKPEEFRALIDRLWPHGPRIELFSRGPAPGWMQWGSQIAEAAE